MDSQANNGSTNGKPGGHGGRSAVNATTPRSNTSDRLLKRALKEKWPIPDAVRHEAVDMLRSAINNKELKIRERVAAARCLASFGRANSASTRDAAFVQRLTGTESQYENAKVVSQTLVEFLAQTHELARLEEAAEDDDDAL
jgi:hypothetical protein